MGEECRPAERVLAERSASCAGSVHASSFLCLDSWSQIAPLNRCSHFLVLGLHVADLVSSVPCNSDPCLRPTSLVCDLLMGPSSI